MKSLAKQPDKDEVLKRLRQVGPDSQRRWGKMSAHQMICHLNDSFKVAMGERSVTAISRMLPGRLVKWFALYAPIRWPHGVPTRPEMNQQVGGTKPVEFETDMRELERLIDRIAREDRDFKWHRHPLFGAMPDRDWLRWGYLHVDHHLRQFGV
jgi:hypothetical protein